MRYRHTDTDLVRSARQQDFISDARQQVSLQDLVFDQSDLIDIFTKYTTSDINDKETMLRSAETVPRLAQRHDQARSTSRPNSARATSTRRREAIHEAVEEVPRIEAEQRTARLARRREEGEGGKEEGREEGQEGRRRSRRSRTRRSRSRPAATAWCRPPKRAKPRAKAAARKVGGGFPVFYPTRLPSGAYYVESNTYEHIQDPRVYHLKDTDGERHAAYRMVGVYELPDTNRTTSASRGSTAGKTRRSSTTRAKRRRSTAANTTSSSTAIGSS